jgi:hypothetical protein
MTWQDAKDALAIALEGLTATLPDGADGDTASSAVRRVFTAPPASIEPGDLPCIILGQSTLQDDWGPEALSEYELTCSLVLRDEDIARAVEWTEAYRERVKTTLRQNVSLGGAVSVINGVSFTAVQDISWAGGGYTGFQFTMPIEMYEAVDFAVGDGVHP